MSIEQDLGEGRRSHTVKIIDFDKCKFKAKYFYKKLKTKGIILRSTEDGYRIKNMLRLTIGSKTDCLKFIRTVESIFKK